ncbi:MAG: hypothetical protein IH588_16195 [Anaerolineales bacterium]|nr:hypothetical protein [Anaerolineales bacterium]
MSGKYTQIGCAVLLSFLVACCGTQITKTEIAAATVTASPAEALDPKAALHENINQVLGTDSRKLPRLTKISYSVPEAGDITITWALNDNVSQNSRIANAQIDATNILKVLENNKTRFIYVILIGTFSMQDEYGTTAEIQAINLGFNKSKLDKIHWEDFQPAGIYDLADVAKIADEWK